MGDQLLAAFGKVLITPEEEVGLQGFNPSIFRAHPPQDILDDLHARILILEDGKHRRLIVSVDSCLANEEAVEVRIYMNESQNRHMAASFPPDTKEKWADVAGTDEHSVVILATHTHSAPEYYSEKYTKRIEEKIAELTQCLVPVKVKSGHGKSAISAFRRPSLDPNLEFEIDQSLHVVLFETETGKLLGGVVNYAVHPTILHPPAPANRISAELVGWAMKELEDEVGGNFVSLFTQGFAGDVCPILPGHQAQEDTDVYGNVQKAGHQLFLDIKQTMEQMQPVEAKQCILMKRQVDMPNRPGFPYKDLDITLTGIALGDLVFFCSSGEIFNGYKAKLDALSPFPHTVLVSYVNGYSGYLPTAEAFRDGLGGYEVGTTPYTEEADRVFTSSAGNLLQELWRNRS